MGLLDEHAMYLIQLIPTFTKDTVFRITGDYYAVMYFSYQLYTDTADQFAEIKFSDFQLPPKSGRNPFTEPDVLPSQSGQYQVSQDTMKYLMEEPIVFDSTRFQGPGAELTSVHGPPPQIHFTLTGKNGLPNERAVNVSALGLLVARFYKPTPSVNLPLDLSIVPPRWEEGSLSNLATGWKNYPACPGYIREAAGLEESW